MENSKQRPDTQTLHQWLDLNIEFLKQQDTFSYSLEKTLDDNTTYPSTVIIETNIGVCDMLTYIQNAYDDNMCLKVNPKIRITSIQ